ncbi:MAG: TIGR04282 family arsenosugar biosynthesis glycosyltransferase [Gammaproteobacteria bacterium]|nr:MAG: TIGR04282 family arsenosugar biosynthesis glycosyltransferase [Gammaproteobacteria bacterium]
MQDELKESAKREQPELVIFAKQPIPGQAKTRLQTVCSPDQAARLAEAMIQITVYQACKVWPGPVRLCCTPDSRHEVFRHLSETTRIQLSVQVGENLGARMLNAIRTSVKCCGSAAILGTDVPHCPGAILADAYQVLLQGRSVIGPSKDGGYYFIGLTQPEPELFEGIAWGGERVFNDTQVRAQMIGMTLDRLPVLCDLDTWQDIVNVLHDHADLKSSFQSAVPELFKGLVAS